MDKVGTCVGGIEAIEFYESLHDRIESNEQEMYERALNRFKYEIAKGIGKKIRTIKAVRAWHHDTYVCGKCGFGANEAGYSYCPNCGTAYLRNPVTEEKIENHQVNIDEWIGSLESEVNEDI